MDARRFSLIFSVLLAALALGPASLAQDNNPFRTVVQVNDGVITDYEITQRQAFARILRSPDTSREAVLNTLIEERLQTDAADRAGLQLDPIDVERGMAEFAARANLSVEEFLSEIGQNGVDPETYRAFITAGVTWRQLVRRRFSSQARISDAEIDRAVSLGEGQGNVQVLLSEIVLPMAPQVASLNGQRAQLISSMTDFDDFERAARQFSVAPSRTQGGELEWLRLSDLPPPVAPLFLTMEPGEVTDPVPLAGGQALALFQLRDIRDARPSSSETAEITYILLRVPAEDTADTLVGRLSPVVNGCDSLYRLAPSNSESDFQKTTISSDDLERSVLAALSPLDPGELAPLPGGAAVAMLCERTPKLGAELSRDDIRDRLFGRKLEDLSASYLSELRADAFIDVK